MTDVNEPAEEVWPRWNDDSKQWDHYGCDHDRSKLDREACRRLNRSRKPEPPDPEWLETHDLVEAFRKEPTLQTRDAFLESMATSVRRAMDLAIHEDGDDADMVAIDFMKKVLKMIEVARVSATGDLLNAVVDFLASFTEGYAEDLQ